MSLISQETFGKNEPLQMDNILEYILDQHNLYRSRRRSQINIPVVSLIILNLFLTFQYLYENYNFFFFLNKIKKVVDIELMAMSWKRIQTPDVDNLDDLCLKSERYEMPGQITETICYKSDDWPSQKDFVNDVFVKIEKSVKYYQMTYSIVFAFGSAMARCKKIIKDNDNGRTVYCYIIVFTYNVKWKPGQEYKKSIDNVSKCISKHSKYDGLCGVEDIERYVGDNEFFNRYGKEPSYLEEWKKTYLSAPPNILYTSDLKIFGNFFLSKKKSNCFLILNFVSSIGNEEKLRLMFLSDCEEYYSSRTCLARPEIKPNFMSISLKEYFHKERKVIRMSSALTEYLWLKQNQLRLQRQIENAPIDVLPTVSSYFIILCSSNLFQNN